jgi:hypothetical protein
MTRRDVRVEAGARDRSMAHKEADFEAAIVESLVENGGYVEGDPAIFNAELGLFERDLVEFVQHTQPEKWDGLVKLYGASARAKLAKRVARQIDARGTVDVLRHGIDEQNKGVRAVPRQDDGDPHRPERDGRRPEGAGCFGAIWESEIPPVVAALSSDASDAQAKAYAGLDSALERFGALTVEQQDEFRDALKRFINVYSFMSQVVPYTDRQLEDWYVYSRALRSVLPHESGQGTIDVSSKVELTHLKVALAEDETDVSLDADAGELEVIFGDGRHFEPDEETLAEIIRQINERLGRTLTKADRIVFEQMEQDWLEDDQLFAQANANDLENFALAFTKVFEASMLARLGKNEDLVMKILDAPEIKEALEAFYVDRVYHSLREDEKALTTFV